MELNGRVALVTGGGTGIGRAVCLRLARAGAKAVVVNYSRSDKDARSTAAELMVHGPDAMAHKADISNENEVKAMIAAVKERYGRLDVLINNAGTTRFIAHPDLDALTDEVWDGVLNVNLKGTFYCCREAAPELRKTGGAIVNIASIAGHRATGSSIVYAVSKAGVLQLTRALAVALAPDVRVNSVSPGLVSTRWFRQFDSGAADLQESSASATTPLQAVATPDHVAQAVMAFVENDMLTGQDVVVDGGKNILY
ncbi:MAG TPA: SDR family oxidoreductase [Candidatus Acidoferrum sp.]|jgi:3-oxoacyl-[acyl-carrier protein] reductase|nr:SDR family oxidoreductase [Candidatus Acidoferrum sp.]